MKSISTLPIKRKMFLVLIAQLLIPILLIGVISLILSMNIIKTQALNRVEREFKLISSNVSEYSHKVYSLSQEFLYDTTICNAIISGSVSDTATSTAIRNNLNEIIFSNTEIDAIHLELNDRHFHLSKKEDNIFSPYSIGYTKLYDSARELNGLPLWHFISTNNNVSHIFLARTIYNPYTFSECGFMIFQLSGNAISSLIAENYNPGTEFVIVSPEKKYITSTGSFPYELIPGELEIISDTMNRMETHNSLILYNTIPTVNWSIVCSINTDILYHSSYWLFVCVLLLCLISGSLLVLFMRYTNLSIFQPLYTLSENMNEWNENIIFKNPFPARNDEIGTLYGCFEKMSSQIRTLIHKYYKKEMLSREAELKMLKAQINPHFLFNTLEAINSLAYLKKEYDLCKMITSLSNILNRSIKQTKDYITLDEELAFADDYIYIMQSRYPNIFTVIKDIPAEAGAIRIPHMTLQPLIENAIKHGIIPSKRQCTLKIKAQITDDALIICIIDNGVGISEEKLQMLNKSFIEDNSESESIGLLNINKRLKLIFGNNHHLIIESKEQEFTSVTAKFKLAYKSQPKEN